MTLIRNIKPLWLVTFLAVLVAAISLSAIYFFRVRQNLKPETAQFDSITFKVESRLPSYVIKLSNTGELAQYFKNWKIGSDNLKKFTVIFVPEYDSRTPHVGITVGRQGQPITSTSFAENGNEGIMEMFVSEEVLESSQADFRISAELIISLFSLSHPGVSKDSDEYRLNMETIRENLRTVPPVLEVIRK